MSKTGTIHDVMKTNLVEMNPESTVREAARQMRKSGVGDVLIVNDGELKGVVTDRDLVVRCLATDADPDGKTVGEVCSGEVVAVSPDDSIDRAVELMQKKAIRRIPVVKDGLPVGMSSLPVASNE